MCVCVHVRVCLSHRQPPLLLQDLLQRLVLRTVCRGESVCFKACVHMYLSVCVCVCLCVCVCSWPCVRVDVCPSHLFFSSTGAKGSPDSVNLVADPISSSLAWNSLVRSSLLARIASISSIVTCVVHQHVNTSLITHPNATVTYVHVMHDGVPWRRLGVAPGPPRTGSSQPCRPCSCYAPPCSASRCVRVA